MHKYILAFAVIAAVAAQQYQEQNQQQQQPAEILKHDSYIGTDGYHFTFETSDGTSRQEQGNLKQISDEVKALEVTGSYKYVAPDGVTYTVTFTADENGYQPSQHVEHSGSN